MPFIGNKPTAVPLTGADIQDGTVQLADLSATGTKDATTFLRGDNTFASAGGVNTPAFRVYLNTNTAQTQNTDTKIPYNTEDFDTDNAYDNSSNYRFTPQTSGKYFIQVQVGFDGADANGRVIVYIKKNGSDQSFSMFGIGSTADYGGICQHSDIVTLNGSTDYVEGFVNYTGTDNMRGQTQKTFMLGYRIIE